MECPKPETARYAVLYGNAVIGYFDKIQEAHDYAEKEVKRLAEDHRMHFTMRLALLFGDDCNWPEGL